MASPFDLTLATGEQSRGVVREEVTGHPVGHRVVSAESTVAVPAEVHDYQVALAGLSGNLLQIGEESIPMSLPVEAANGVCNRPAVAKHLFEPVEVVDHLGQRS